ncbi:hypothetical protein EXIGLDRAFT_279358 [Exidia glandulosa HHB12029]|uniref:Uncharacterized protein n=1 Tax=Exidia glandulosa HHB12029 TaxID=1314781 RepID=A0A165DJB9_EXIGL|nr:hypothetical protein EXIGLDRAFT_279358 [Exidia glandulosa HHB12029]
MKTTDPAQEAMLKAFQQQRQAMNIAFSKQEDELAAGHRDRQKRVATFVDSLAKASETTRARLQSDWDQEVARLRKQSARSQDSRRDRASQDANAHDALASRTLRGCQDFANESNKERNTAYDRALEELYALCNRTLGDNSSHSAKLPQLNGRSSRPSVLLKDLLKTIRVELELPDPPPKSRDAAGNDLRVPGTQDSVIRALNHPVDTGALPDPDPTQRGDPTTTQPLDAPPSFLEELDTKFASDQQFREAYHASAEEQSSNALTRWNNEVANTRGRLDSLFDSFTHSVVTPQSQSSSKSSARWDSFYSAEQRRNQEVLAVFRRAVADTEGTIHRAVSSVRLLEFRAASMNINAEGRAQKPISGIARLCRHWDLTPRYYSRNVGSTPTERKSFPACGTVIRIRTRDHDHPARIASSSRDACKFRRAIPPPTAHWILRSSLSLK